MANTRSTPETEWQANPLNYKVTPSKAVSDIPGLDVESIAKGFNDQLTALAQRALDGQERITANNERIAELQEEIAELSDGRGAARKNKAEIATLNQEIKSLTEKSERIEKTIGKIEDAARTALGQAEAQGCGIVDRSVVIKTGWEFVGKEAADLPPAPPLPDEYYDRSLRSMAADTRAIAQNLSEGGVGASLGRLDRIQGAQRESIVNHVKAAMEVDAIDGVRAVDEYTLKHNQLDEIIGRCTKLIAAYVDDERSQEAVKRLDRIQQDCVEAQGMLGKALAHELAYHADTALKNAYEAECRTPTGNEEERRITNGERTVLKAVEARISLHENASTSNLSKVNTRIEEASAEIDHALGGVGIAREMALNNIKAELGLREAQPLSPAREAIQAASIDYQVEQHGLARTQQGYNTSQLEENVTRYRGMNAGDNKTWDGRASVQSDSLADKIGSALVTTGKYGVAIILCALAASQSDEIGHALADALVNGPLSKTDTGVATLGTQAFVTTLTGLASFHMVNDAVKGAEHLAHSIKNALSGNRGHE